MLKIRREWRRTSSSQAEPSPWRHCWTSWASCSNLRQPRIAACPGLHMMERKLPPKSSLRRPRNGTIARILLIPKGKHKQTLCADVDHLAFFAAFSVSASLRAQEREGQVFTACDDVHGGPTGVARAFAFAPAFHA